MTCNDASDGRPRPRSARTLALFDAKVVVDIRAPLWTVRTTEDFQASLDAVSVGDPDPAHCEEVRVEDLPCGVLERRADGSEVLETADGIRLELDGAGGARVMAESAPCCGFFLVLDDREPDALGNAWSAYTARFGKHLPGAG